MMGRIVVKMKRWWIVALVLTLALSLTSCAGRRRNLQGNYGVGVCDGTLGSYDAYVIPSKGNTGMFEVSLIPVSVNEGDIVKIVVLNQSLNYKPLLEQVTVHNEEQIFAGYLSESELNRYDTLAIIPWDPSQSGVTPIEQNNERDTLCALPAPGYQNSDGLSKSAP